MAMSKSESNITCIAIVVLSIIAFIGVQHLLTKPVHVDTPTNDQVDTEILQGFGIVIGEAYKGKLYENKGVWSNAVNTYEVKPPKPYGKHYTYTIDVTPDNVVYKIHAVLWADMVERETGGVIDTNIEFAILKKLLTSKYGQPSYSNQDNDNCRWTSGDRSINIMTVNNGVLIITYLDEHIEGTYADDHVRSIDVDNISL